MRRSKHRFYYVFIGVVALFVGLLALSTYIAVSKRSHGRLGVDVSQMEELRKQGRGT
jgi:hypothetical protein